MSKKMIFDKTSGVPFWINLEDKNLGHMITVGPSGAGKSALNNVLLAQLMKSFDAANQSNSLHVVPDEEEGE